MSSKHSTSTTALRSTTSGASQLMGVLETAPFALRFAAVALLRLI